MQVIQWHCLQGHRWCDCHGINLNTLTPEKMFLYRLWPGSRNGDVYSHLESGHPFLIFFSKNHSTGTSSLLCLIPRSSWDCVQTIWHRNKPILSLTDSPWRCFLFLKDCKGPSESTWFKYSANFNRHYLSTCNKFYDYYNWQHNSNLENVSKEVGQLPTLPPSVPK